MNVLFAHDHKFSVDENGKVYSYLMDHNMWDRYLPFFDSITIVARRINISSKNPKQMKGMKSAQADRVNFSLLGETINNDGSINKKPDQFQKYKSIKNLVSKSDCVIARLPSIIGYMACREAIKQHKKYAVEVVACAWDSNWYHGGKINKVMALPSLFAMKHYVKRADYAIYVTDHFLQHRYPCNGKTGIASNVSIDAVEHEVIDKRIDHITSLKYNDKIIFGIVGPLHVNFKGHKTAILALSKAKNNIPPFELRCIGAGDPKRWQQLANNVGIGENIYFDGAHNVAGIHAFLDSVALIRPQNPILLFSMVSDKDYEKAIQLLAERGQWEQVIVTTISDKRGIPAEDIARIFSHFGQQAVVIEDSRKAYEWALKGKKRGQALFCTGSLYFIGELLEITGGKNSD